MNREQVSERLAALAAGSTGRSKAARLRDVFDDVEAALHAGVSREAVVRELAEAGLDFTVPTFALTLKRIRKVRREKMGNIGTSNRPNPARPVRVANAEPQVREATPTSSAGLQARGPDSDLPTLPDDWRTCKAFPGLHKLLTKEQQEERKRTRDNDPSLHRSIYDPPAK